MAYRLIECMKNGTAPDIDVYDAAAWSAPGPLSEACGRQRQRAAEDSPTSRAANGRPAFRSSYTGRVKLNPRTFGWLVRRSLISTFNDGCIGYAKGAAYSALLSFFPLLTSVAAIMVQTRADFVAATLEGFLSQIVPPGTEDLVVRQFRVMGARPLGLLIGAGLISLWAASGVIKSLIEGFQAVYRVPRNRGILRQSGVAMSLVLLSAVPLVFASLLLLFGGQVEVVVLRWLSVDPYLHPLSGRLAVRRPHGALCPGGGHHRQRDLFALLFRTEPETALGS